MLRKNSVFEAVAQLENEAKRIHTTFFSWFSFPPLRGKLSLPPDGGPHILRKPKAYPIDGNGRERGDGRS